jgi:MinD-like ATPase involved in chromosome partitioning or flagellar assembly
LWAKDYFASKWCTQEMALMLSREREFGFRTDDNPRGLVIPAVIHDGKDFPEALAEIQKFEIQRQFNVRMAVDSPRAEELDDILAHEAEAICAAINAAPPWRAQWPKTAAGEFRRQLSTAPPSQRDMPRYTDLRERGRWPMGSVVTFYSYKGGVGRSMALANIAVLLAREGQRVLIIDWDLEAPGLERYFQDFSIYPTGTGLLQMLIDCTGGRRISYRDYTWEIEIDSGETITFLPSGREQDPARYSGQLARFDWNNFFAIGGGDYLEDLRSAWKNDFDIVLIDSRTGLSDMGGVCTIQLPDVLVVMFTPNDQSMLGARNVMRYARKARQALAYPRMELTVFPLPARISSATEFQESQRWIERFSKEFDEFYDDWLPSWAQPREVLQKVKIPQVDFFGFGEKLSVVEQGVADPAGMGYVYDMVARVLKDDFRNAHEIIGLRERAVDRQHKDHRPGVAEDYQYDLYVSHANLSYMSAWLEQFVTILRYELSAAMGREATIFWNRHEVILGQSWPNAT